MRAQDSALGGSIYIAHRDLEEESIELHLGKRIRARNVEGVLRPKHKKELVEGSRDIVHCDLFLCHALKECSLNLRSGSIDLVSENYMREYRPMHEMKLSRFRIKDVYTQNISGEHIGSKLNTPKGKDRVRR
jgi:hypothetical protein